MWKACARPACRSDGPPLRFSFLTKGGSAPGIVRPAKQPVPIARHYRVRLCRRYAISTERRWAMIDISKAGTFKLGDRVVKRMGYGAMQLAGKGVFGQAAEGPRRRNLGAARSPRERRRSCRHQRLLWAPPHQPSDPRGAPFVSRPSRHRHQDRRPARRGRIVDPGDGADRARECGPRQSAPSQARRARGRQPQDHGRGP